MALSGPPVSDRVIEDDGRTQILENDLGLVRRVRTDGESMPTWIKFPVESGRDWLNKIRPRLTPAQHTYPDLEQELAVAAQHPEDPLGAFLVGLYAFWRNFWGEEKLAYAFYDHPETVHEMAQAWLTMHCDCTPRLLEAARVDYVLFHEDMAFKNGPLIGPKLFDEFMKPYYRDLFAHLRARGQHRFLLDSDGNNGAVLERFIGLGMNGLYPFEQAAGCDVIAFREAHPHFFIWGGIDKRVLLRTRSEIDREVMSKVPLLWESGGFIPSIDHAVPPCPNENFEYFLELVRSLAP
jgi:uroporphyrinogen-III decarboxylase